MPSSGTVRLVRPAAPLGGVDVLFPGRRSQTWWTQIPATPTSDYSNAGLNIANSAIGVVFPFRLSRGFDWDAVLIEVMTNVTGASAQFGVYDLAPLYDDGAARCVWMSGSIDCATTGTKTDLSPGRLTAGLYGLWGQSTTAVSIVRGTTMPIVGQPFPVWHGTTPATTSQRSTSFTLLNSVVMGQPFTRWAIDSTGGQGAPVPVMWFRRRSDRNP
jgi:hypothetical protein